jgi:hypothetical protein
MISSKVPTPINPPIARVGHKPAKEGKIQHLSRSGNFILKLRSPDALGGDRDVC